MDTRNVWNVEKDAQGAWVVYGSWGKKKYYDCTKKEAVKQYEKQCKEMYIYK